MSDRHNASALMPINGSHDKLDELERDIATTRISLGRTLNELTDRLLPQSAEQLVNVSFDAAGGSFGENAVIRCLEFMRAHPLPTAVIGCSALASLLLPMEEERPLQLPADAAAVQAAPRGPNALLKRHPAMVAAVGLTLGAVAAILLLPSRAKASPQPPLAVKREAPYAPAETGTLDDNFPAGAAAH